MENQLVQALARSFLMKLKDKTLVDGQIANLAVADTEDFSMEFKKSDSDIECDSDDSASEC